MITHDLAGPILQNVPNMSQDLRADLWDLFHDSTAEELAQKLANVPIADSLKRQLITARAKSLEPDATTGVVDKTVEALHRVAQLPKDVLDLAEKHHLVAKFLVDVNSKS